MYSPDVEYIMRLDYGVVKYIFAKEMNKIGR